MDVRADLAEAFDDEARILEALNALGEEQGLGPVHQGMIPSL